VVETEENTAAGELNVGDLTLDDATTTAGEGLESQDPTQQIATILRILHACLANHASRRHFDVRSEGKQHDQNAGSREVHPPIDCREWVRLYVASSLVGATNIRSLDHRLATDPSLVPDLQVMGALWSLACNNEPSLMDLFERFKHQIGSNAVSESASSEIPEFPATLPMFKMIGKSPGCVKTKLAEMGNVAGNSGISLLALSETAHLEPHTASLYHDS
jgi:hypothetical protein